MQAVVSQRHPGSTWDGVLVKTRAMIRSVFEAAARQRPLMACPPRPSNVRLRRDGHRGPGTSAAGGHFFSGESGRVFRLAAAELPERGVRVPLPRRAEERHSLGVNKYKQQVEHDQTRHETPGSKCNPPPSPPPLPSPPLPYPTLLPANEFVCLSNALLPPHPPPHLFREKKHG